MGLNIGVFGGKQFFCPFNGKAFCNINVFKAAIITLARVAFGIFIGHDRALSLLHLGADKIFRGDHFEGIIFPVGFIYNGLCDLRIKTSK